MGELELLLKVVMVKLLRATVERYGWGWTLAGACVVLAVISLVVFLAGMVLGLARRSLERLVEKHPNIFPLVPALRRWWSGQFALQWLGIVVVFSVIAAVVKLIFRVDLIYTLGLGAAGLLSLRLVKMLADGRSKRHNPVHHQEGHDNESALIDDDL